MINQEDKLQSLAEQKTLLSQPFSQQLSSIQKSDKASQQLQQDTQSLLQQYLCNQNSQSNQILMNNNQFPCQMSEESNIIKVDNQMLRCPLNAIDNNMLILQNFMVIQPQFNSESSQSNIAHNIYQSTNCTNLVYPNTNNSFQTGMSSLGHPHLNQINNQLIPSTYTNNSQNLTPGMTVGGFIQASDSLQQFQNKQYQYKQLQQTTAVSKICSDDQNQTQIIGCPPTQQGIAFNYESQAINQQQLLMQQYPLQAQQLQQLSNLIIPTNFKPQTSYSQINISNSQHQDNSNKIISQIRQNQNNGQVNQLINSGSPSSAELQQLNFYNQQDCFNNMNQSFQKGSLRVNDTSKSSVLEIDKLKNKDKVKNKDVQGKTKQIDFQNNINIHNFNQTHSSVQKFENLKDHIKFEQLSQQFTNQTNQPLNIYTFQKMKEEYLIQEQNNQYPHLFSQKFNQKTSFDESSQESASHFILSSQSIRNIQNQGRIECSGDNAEDYRVQLNKKNDQNSRFSQSTYSSLSPSKTNHLTSKYRHMSYDKTNTMNNSSFILDQGNNLEVYVDNRKRRTSIDHSFYIQLGNLLTDKKVVKEFTNLILCQGIEKVSSQKEINQSHDQNQNKSTNSEQIKRYKQLLNQTFFEIKHQQTPKGSSKDISLTYKSEDLNLKLEENNTENEDNLLNDRSNNFDIIENYQQNQSFNQKQFNKIIQVNQIISSIQQGILTKIPLLFKEENILDSINLIPSGQYQVYSNLQNMCIQFVRGEKRKRFKERNKDSQYMSRFHNLNRLFFYQIMSIYSYESLSCFQIDPTISEQMRNIISFIKIHSKLQFINQKQKSALDSSNPLISKTQNSPKQDKKKRFQSEIENSDLLQNPVPSKQFKNINDEGQKININQQDKKQESKKSSKLTQKELQKQQKANNFNQENDLSNFNSESDITKLKQSSNIITTDHINKNQHSGNHQKHEYFNQNIQCSSIIEGETHEHSSHTPSPIIKMDKEGIFSQLQETQKKSSSSQQRDYFSISKEIEGDLNFEQNKANNISNDIKSSSKQDKTKKQQKIQQSNLKKQKNSQSESSNQFEDSNLKEEDYALEDEILNDNDLEDLDYNFPIKNYKIFYRILKVENYTHSHYNTLFLKLNPQSIDHLRKQSKDVDSHWLAYKIDLRVPENIPPEKIQYVNIMKSLFYKIFIHFNNINFTKKQQEQEKILNQILNDPSQPMTKDSQEFKSIELRLDYYLRVVQGIQKLNQGYYSHKF